MRLIKNSLQILQYLVCIEDNFKEIYGNVLEKALHF